ncbi:M28 family peptidase [Simiduia aestuariiviva]|uniref:Carboxypeptidase Q n=1 Tax=Simiduia aestuariiviva TaxID=1510459 RepID=A0A839UKQ9_9GAMM|nr:M28 family peptidase [Simiduia aestuariiviva]MBB3167190.1 Zn-dependent M28 family amino/carboxypeptidase [Simiduia aestuariiviva]
MSLRILFPALIAIALTACATPQPEDAATSLREHALQDQAGYAFVRDLTTEVGPRMGGTEADARAVAWTKARFEQMGFDKVWTEPVTFPQWQRTHERAHVLGKFPQPLHITALGGSVGTDGELQGEVVMVDDYAALVATPSARVKDKIVFIKNRMRKHKEGAGYGEAVIARGKGALEAEAKGAKALLIRSIGTDSHRFAHTGMMSMSAGSPQIPAAALSNPDADQLERLIAKGKVNLSLDINVGWTGEYTSHNVIAEITGNKKPDEIIVIGGHLDSWDLGTGALDDGAGVAITAGAAYQFIKHRLRPGRTIRVVAFSNEEQGLVGAKAYAKAHANELDRHIVASESDFGAGPIWALKTRLNNADEAFIARATALLKPLGIEYLGNDATSGGPDIIPLAEKGVQLFQLKQDGTDYFDYHHTADDTLDKIDPVAFNQNIAAWTVMLHLFANEWQMDQ